jgi:alpha-L-fucosidase
MIEVWFDGSLVFDVGDILKQHAPKAIVFQGPQATIRWVGNEDGVAPYPAWNSVRENVEGKKWGDYTAADGDPNGTRWLPNECDARIRATWFWKTNNEHTLKSVAQLMDMYERSVGHGGVLLLNNTPDRTGVIPDADARRSAEFGAALEKRYGVAATDTAGTGHEFVVQPSTPTKIDRVVLMEDISQGERVRKYTLEAQIDGEWKPLAEGTAIGHKKIDRVPAMVVQAVRMRVLESVGTPCIRRFGVFASMP